MEEEKVNYKFLRLTSGDSIICKTTDDCKQLTGKRIISVSDPVILNMLRLPRDGVLIESYVLFPLFSFSEENVYEIPVHQIVVATNIKESLKNNYLEYIMCRDNQDELYDESDDAEETDDGIIEELFEKFEQSLGDVNDENNDDTGERDIRINRGTRRTLH
jgi:hypothetical protein